MKLNPPIKSKKQKFKQKTKQKNKQGTGQKTETIYLGSDHAGFKLKEKIKAWLEKNKINFEDLGNTVFDPQDDYPDYAQKVAEETVKAKSLGLLICGSAQGMCIAANKIKGARAVIPHSVKEAALSREHNDANILCMSGWDTTFALSTQMIKTFIQTRFSQEKRHLRRVNKIKKLERR